MATDAVKPSRIEKTGVLLLLPEIFAFSLVGLMISNRIVERAASNPPFTDISRDLLLLLPPLAGAIIGALATAWRNNRQRTVDERAILKRRGLRFSAAALIVSPVVGFLIGWSIGLGPVRQSVIPEFTMAGAKAGVILAIAVAAASWLLRIKDNRTVT